jgi:hypothetical protein
MIVTPGDASHSQLHDASIVLNLRRPNYASTFLRTNDIDIDTQYLWLWRGNQHLYSQNFYLWILQSAFLQRSLHLTIYELLILFAAFHQLRTRNYALDVHSLEGYVTTLTLMG